jgi:hypothetical protein
MRFLIPTSILEAAQLFHDVALVVFRVELLNEVTLDLQS